MNADKYSRTIPRELVHKRCIAEVLVTSLKTAPRNWTFGAQLPRQHSFHSDALGEQGAYHDPLLALEAFRQGCIAATHDFYEVPLDSRYTLRSYGLTVLDVSRLRRGLQPLDLEFGVEVREEFRSRDGGPVRGLEITAVATSDGLEIMEFTGAFGWLSADKWELFRAGASWDPGPQAIAAEASLVGRRTPANVVIGNPEQLTDGTLRAPIVVDLEHPTMFDHPLDHLPGGLILEACRQLSLAALGTGGAGVVGPTRLHCEFSSFTEMGDAVTASVAPVDQEHRGFRALVMQGGQNRACIDLAFAAV